MCPMKVKTESSVRTDQCTTNDQARDKHQPLFHHHHHRRHDAAPRMHFPSLSIAAKSSSLFPLSSPRHRSAQAQMMMKTVRPTTLRPLTLEHQGPRQHQQHQQQKQKHHPHLHHHHHHHHHHQSHYGSGLHLLAAGGNGDSPLPSLAHVTSFRQHFAFHESPLEIKLPATCVLVPTQPSPQLQPNFRPLPRRQMDQLRSTRKRNLDSITPPSSESDSRPGSNASDHQPLRKYRHAHHDQQRDNDDDDDNEKELEEEGEEEEEEEEEEEDASPGRVGRSKRPAITLDLLRPYFEQPIASVAAELGVCKTMLKKLCRKQGIVRWPARQLRSLRKSVESMESAIELFDGDEKAAYLRQLTLQQQKLELLRYDPTLIEDDEDPAQSSGSPNQHPAVKTSSKRPRATSTRSYSQCIIQLDMLRTHFDKPLNEAAQLLGVCPSVLKKICREQGLAKWPYRPLLSIRKRIKAVQNALENGCSSPQEKHFYQLQLAVHGRKRDELLHPERMATSSPKPLTTAAVQSQQQQPRDMQHTVTRSDSSNLSSNPSITCTTDDDVRFSLMSLLN